MESVGAVGSEACSMLTMRTGVVATGAAASVPSSAPTVGVVAFSIWFSMTSLNTEETVLAIDLASSGVAAVAVISTMRVFCGATTETWLASSCTVMSSLSSSMTGWSTRPLVATSTYEAMRPSARFDAWSDWVRSPVASLLVRISREVAA